jgi:DNA-binding transcriptional ArsR family regulator
MRPLFHPAISDVSVEGVLHALSDPVRVAIYADIVGSECSQSCSSFLRVSEKPIPKSTLSQHFKILREAGLIHSERCGVELQNSSRCAEIEKRFPGLIRAILNAHNLQLEEKTRAAHASKRKTGKPPAGKKR